MGEARIKVALVEAKRVASWGVECSMHGRVDRTHRTKRIAIGEASQHAQEAHAGQAVVVHP